MLLARHPPYLAKNLGLSWSFETPQSILLKNARTSEGNILTNKTC
jgi:hypothetical protein